jgi:hypothetical protein
VWDRLTLERELAELGAREFEAAPSSIGPFPASPYALPLDTTNKAFRNCVAAVARDRNVSALTGAVVDLTGNPKSPSYFGLNDTEMLYVGSLAKIYPMYAAFELKRRVQEHAKTMIKSGLSTATSGWERQVFSALSKAWQPKLNAAFPGLPQEFPKLAEIFVLSPRGDVKFAERDPPVTDAELDAPVGGTSPQLKAPIGRFRDWMRLMLRWSNNAAAGKCIRVLSYPYLNGALAAAGFFDPLTKSGLWMSGDYRGNDWLPADRAGQPLSRRWAGRQGRRVSNFTGTACQVARFMTLLAQGRLVDRASSADMLRMMTGGSYIGEALWQAKPRRDYSWTRAKLGLGNDLSYHDCAIIRVDRDADPKKVVRYVSVVLGSLRTRAHLHKLAVGFHDCIVGLH